MPAARLEPDGAVPGPQQVRSLPPGVLYPGGSSTANIQCMVLLIAVPWNGRTWDVGTAPSICCMSVHAIVNFAPNHDDGGCVILPITHLTISG